MTLMVTSAQVVETSVNVTNDGLFTTLTRTSKPHKVYSKCTRLVDSAYYLIIQTLNEGWVSERKRDRVGRIAARLNILLLSMKLRRFTYMKKTRLQKRISGRRDAPKSVATSLTRGGGGVGVGVV